MHERVIAWGMGTVVMLTGRTSTSSRPTYTQGELKASSERRTGRWHPNDLIDGNCETFL